MITRGDDGIDECDECGTVTCTGRNAAPRVTEDDEPS
jgi:hypothetical protein